MDENSKATQTWGTVDWVNLSPSRRPWKFLTLANIALLTYRFLVAAGIITTIICMLHIEHKQLHIFNVMMSHRHRDSRILNESAIHPAGLNYSTTRPPSENRTGPLSSLYIQYRTVFGTLIPYDGWLRRVLFQEYLVYNPSCVIPNYPMFHKDVKPYFRRMKEVNCTKQPLLSSVTPSEDDSRIVLNLHKTRMSQYQVSSLNHVDCCYSLIYSDNGNSTVDECTVFDLNVTLNSSADFARITCIDKSAMIYDNLHALLPVKSQVLSKMKRIETKNDTHDDLSVMIIGLDSVSRLNLLRTMPETVKYLESNGWYALNGYHKVENNGFHGLNGPVLTGRTANQLKATCGRKEGLVDCPSIWKMFSDRSYVTAYGDDGSELDSFGEFKQPPADYLLRARKSFKQDIANMPKECHSKCLGSKTNVNRIFDFSTDFATRFVRYPTFSLFWVNSVGNGEMNCPSMVDHTLTSYFEDLDRSGALNRTMVVFMSDRGYQKLDFRRTNMGFVEDSLPFLYVWLPEWYRARYPNKVANLARNKYVLTSQFDLHVTLVDVLGATAKAGGCPGCVSLFDPVPRDRGCADAGISEAACTCMGYEEISAESTIAKQMGLLVAANINGITAEHSNYLRKGYTCSMLGIKSIISARKQVIRNPTQDDQLYLIQVVTSPGNTTTEAVIKLNTLEVLSLTGYTSDDSQTFCMKSREAKPWCFCQRL